MATPENRPNTKDAYQQEWRELSQLLLESTRRINIRGLNRAIEVLDSRGWCPEIRPGDDPKDNVNVTITEPQYPNEAPRYIDLGIFPGDAVTVSLGYQLTGRFSSGSGKQIASASVHNLQTVEVHTHEIVFSGNVEDDFGHVVVESASLDIEGSVIHAARDYFPNTDPKQS